MTAESINYVANQVILLYTKGRPTVEGIDVREVEAWVVPALAEVGVADYWQKYKLENQADVDGYWLMVYDVALTDDATLGRKVAIFPETPLALPKNRGVVTVRSSAGQLPDISYANWENMADGSLLTFASDWYYAPLAGKVVILPACKDKTRVPFSTVKLTLAVSNNATMTETQVLLVCQRVFPLMDKRYGVQPDTRTDDYPTTQ